MSQVQKIDQFAPKPRRKRADQSPLFPLLPWEYYERDTVTVAQALVGQILVHQTRAGAAGGRIVEVEAYLGNEDPASHAYRGLTLRNRAMFGAPGTVYVYFTYGMHYCLNVVTEPPGIPGAVLIRALEPLYGIPLMRRRRRMEQIKNLARGPGRLSQALAVNLKHNGADLTSGNLVILDSETDSLRIGVSGRIGIRQGREKPLRFYLMGSPYVSHPQSKPTRAP